MGPRCAHQNAISQNWEENRRENQNKREWPKSSLELLGIVQRVFHYFVFAFSSLAISVAHLYEFWWAIEKTSKPTILFPIFPSQPNTPLPHFLSSLFSFIKVLLVWWILGMIKRRRVEILFEVFGWCSPQTHQNVLSPNWGENIRENWNKREGPKSPRDLLCIVQRGLPLFHICFSSLTISSSTSSKGPSTMVPWSCSHMSHTNNCIFA